MTYEHLRLRGREYGVLALVLLAMTIPACAPKTPPPVAPGLPQFPDFVFPQVPERIGDARSRGRHEVAWRYLQAGDLRTAAKEYTSLVSASSVFYPAETGLGYVLVAERRFADALGRFDRVLRRVPAYAPALAGRGEALAATGQVDLAIASFEAARAADPGLTDLGRRVDVLRFGRVNELVAVGSRAANAGELDEARRAYEQALAASPESAFLYRDLGGVELRAGLLDQAVAHLDRAVALDGNDARAWVTLAEAQEKSGHLDEAVAALDRALEAEPSDAVRRSRDRLIDRVEFAKLPLEYRAISTSSRVDRGDLAALLGVRIGPAIPAARRNTGVVVTDARTHWAATWIMSVTRAGLMEAYPNHTFQPRTAVRRVDLAQVVLRVLTTLGALPARSARPAIADVPGDHLSYQAVAAAVATGVMPLLDGGMFRPARPVSGAEAIEVVGRLEKLANRNRVTEPRS
jgi:tetratricopeptide (TPR) repeat protein